MLGVLPILRTQSSQPNFGNARMLDANTPSSLELEMPPTGWMRVSDARKIAANQLSLAILKNVTEAWAGELPEDLWPKAQREVTTGVHAAVRVLTLALNSMEAPERWGSNWDLPDVPAYWEPAVASVTMPALSEFQLRAYRWAAAMIGVFVRNRLEELHSRYTSDQSMRTLNRGVRNAAYDVILCDQWIAYHLARWPARLLLWKASGMSQINVPSAAG